MHIPDGFLSPGVWSALDVVSIPAVGWAARRAQQDTEDRRIPLMGVMGAFVFAAQMINFPVGLGTSAHLLGSALLAIVLGPAAAVVVMTGVLAIQAFVFQDGGIVVLGANVFNMAIAGVLAGALPYRMLGAKWRSGAIFAGGALSVLASAFLALAQLALSGVRVPAQILGITIVLFFVSAAVEGAITVAAVRAIDRLSPSAVRAPNEVASPAWGVLAAAAVLLAAVGILLASTAPDGIQHLAQQLGLAEHSPAWLAAPMAGYELKAFPDGWMRKAAAGVAGLVLIYGLCLATERLLAKRRA
jgi:cobalt/nickel transport system permease protein